MKTKLLWCRMQVLCFCSLIFWQSHFPSLVVGPSRIPFSDKILHLVAYTVLSFFVARWLKAERPGAEKQWIFFVAIILTSLFGLSDEFHQSFIDGRTASVFDFFADCAGAALGSWVFGRQVLRKPKNLY